MAESVARPAGSLPRPSRWPRLMMVLSLLAGMACALPCAAQQAQSPEDSLIAQDNMQTFSLPAIPPNYGANAPALDNTSLRLTERQLEMINVERQKTMVADANKLLKLARELNAEVNSAHAGKLTEDQLSQVKEIEKLAHKVRDEMTFSVQETLPIQPSPTLYVP